MRSTTLLAVLLLSFSTTSAFAGGVSLGANMSLAQLRFSETSESFVFTAPSTPSSSLQPGLRLGFHNPSGLDDFFFETGVVAVEGYTLWTLTANYQRALTRNRTSPYVTAGGGVQSYGFFFFGQEPEAKPLFGGGVGIRHILGNGHGALRAEGRFDVLQGAEPYDNVSSIALKLGFDLWLE